MTEYNIRLNPNCAAVVNTGLKFKSGDKGITLVIIVEEIDTAGTTAKIVFKRANGTSVESDITGTDGVYTYKTLGNEFAVPGKTVADVKLYANDDRVSTASFVFEVCGDTMDGLGAGTGGYSDRLEQLVKETEKAGELTEQAKEELETAENDMEKMKAEMAAILQNFREQYSEVGTLNPCGTWTSGATYQIRDVVYHNSSSWISLIDNNTAEPTDANKAYWMRSTDLQIIIDGTVPAGDSKKLGGITSEAWQSKLDAIQTVSSGTLDVGWYRIAEYNANLYYQRGVFAHICDIIIRRFDNVVNQHVKLSFSAVADSFGFKVNEVKTPVSAVYTKIRYVKDTNVEKAYIEVYCSKETAKTAVTILAESDGVNPYWKAITPTATEETVDGVTVTTTYDIPANAKPVTDLDIESAMNAYTYGKKVGRTVEEIEAIYNSLHSSCTTPTTHYYGVVSHGASYSVLGYGEWFVDGYYYNANYGYQIATSYMRDKEPHYRKLINGVWEDWQEFATTADLANYLPKTGGTLASALYTSLKLENTNADITTLGFKGVSGDLGFLGFNGAGNPVFRNVANNYYDLLHSGNVGSHAIVPVSAAAQTITGNTTPVYFKSTNTSDPRVAIKFFRNYTALGYLGYLDVDTPCMITNAGTSTFPLHHDGNSAKVVQATSAPSDTMALWIDITNKKVKAYIDGAWTVIA